MLFRFQCPSCEGKLKAESSQGGAVAACPHCGSPIAVPFGRIGPGTTIGDFLLEHPLGKGGMGEVFLATQLSMDRPVALKILPHGFTKHKAAIERFLHEVQNLARLDHPNIVTAIEAGEDDQVYYLAMRFVDGYGLDTHLEQRGRMSETDALEIVRTVADALHYAWVKHRLLHRDIKPANILIDRDGSPQITDMGLAKSIGDDSVITVYGTILGTPHYMSPEQARGVSDLDIRADMYSLGATLYHLVTGVPPYPGDSALQVMAKHLTEPLPPPQKRNAELSDACAHLLEVMMAKQRWDRHNDYPHLIEDIDRVIAGQTPQQDRPPDGSSTILTEELDTRPLERIVPPGADPSKAIAAKAPHDAPTTALGDLDLKGLKHTEGVRKGTVMPDDAPPAVDRDEFAKRAREALARHRQTGHPRGHAKGAKSRNRETSPLLVTMLILLAIVAVVFIAIIMAMTNR